MNYIDFVKERREIQKLYKIEKKHSFFPIANMAIDGASILRSLSHLDFFGPVIRGIILRVVPDLGGQNLRLSQPAYTFIKDIYIGYLSEKEIVIMAFNSFIHTKNPIISDKFINKYSNVPPFKNKFRNLYKYLKFIKYINEINSYLEFDQKINIQEKISKSHAFAFDPHLFQFCSILNVLLEAALEPSSKQREITLKMKLHSLVDLKNVG